MANLYVTITTHRHLMLLVKEQNIHPVLLGPYVIQSRKTFDSYFQLPSKMLRCKPELANIMVYGTDREVKVSDSMKCCIPNGHHLLCDMHT